MAKKLDEARSGNAAWHRVAIGGSVLPWRVETVSFFGIPAYTWWTGGVKVSSYAWGLLAGGVAVGLVVGFGLVRRSSKLASAAGWVGVAQGIAAGFILASNWTKIRPEAGLGDTSNDFFRQSVGFGFWLAVVGAGILIVSEPLAVALYATRRHRRGRGPH
jgi:hypothetical protein